MTVLTRDLRIAQGATFQLVIQLTGPNMPGSISGYTARMKVRPWAGSDELYASWTSSQITVDDDNKQVVVRVSAEETSELDFVYGAYDLELVSGDGTVYRVAQGTAYLDKEVTDG